MVELDTELTSNSYNEPANLLKKWSIPIDHLEFAYIETCTNGKELERIVRILRSGQEGVYPELTQKAVERLQEVKPHSKVLRVEEPVLDRTTLDPESWKEVTDDLQEWTNEVNKIDTDLQSSKYVKLKRDIPAVRKSEEEKKSEAVAEQQESRNVNANRIKSCDYAAWDKYDPDLELLKEELQEEEEKKEIARKRALDAKNRKKTATTVTIDPNQNLTEAESLVLANREKDYGNEFFKAGDYEEAKKHYTNSIRLKPTVAAYNNRCITNYKLKKYALALEDSDQVLRREPNNIKALLRKAQVLETNNDFERAFVCLERAIYIEPNNSNIQGQIRNLRKKLPKSDANKVRLSIEENDSDIPDLISDSPKNKPKTKKVVVSIPSTSKSRGPATKIVEVPISPPPQRKPKNPVHNLISAPKITEIECDSAKGDYIYQKKNTINLNTKPFNPNPAKLVELPDDEYKLKSILKNKNHATNPRSSASPKIIELDDAADKPPKIIELDSEKPVPKIIGLGETPPKIIEITESIVREPSVVGGEKSIPKIIELESERNGPKIVELTEPITHMPVPKIIELENGNTPKLEVKSPKKINFKEPPVVNGEKSIPKIVKLEADTDNKNGLTIVEITEPTTGVQIIELDECVEKPAEKPLQINTHIEDTAQKTNGENTLDISEQNERNGFVVGSDVTVCSKIQELNTDVETTEKNENNNHEFPTNEILDDNQQPMKVVEIGDDESLVKHISSLSINGYTEQNAPAGGISTDTDEQNNNLNVSKSPHHQMRRVEIDKGCCGEPYPDQEPTAIIATPYEFTKAWQAIRNETRSDIRARLLRRIPPAVLSTVIGTKLDGPMLSDILQCLQLHFTVPGDVQLVEIFLTELAGLPRFDIMAMFMSQTDKIAVANLLSFLQQHGRELATTTLHAYNIK